MVYFQQFYPKNLDIFVRVSRGWNLPPVKVCMILYESLYVITLFNSFLVENIFSEYVFLYLE
jgi:hypothetical protein